MIKNYLAARNELTAKGSPFEVTTVEVRGIPLKAYANAPANLRVLWEASAAFADKEYIVVEGAEHGILICGTGIRISIAANKLQPKQGLVKTVS